MRDVPFNFDRGVPTYDEDDTVRTLVSYGLVERQFNQLILQGDEDGNG